VSTRYSIKKTISSDLSVANNVAAFEFDGLRFEAKGTSVRVSAVAETVMATVRRTTLYDNSDQEGQTFQQQQFTTSGTQVDGLFYTNSNDLTHYEILVNDHYYRIVAWVANSNHKAIFSIERLI
jgi:hypothetical protein